MRQNIGIFILIGLFFLPNLALANDVCASVFKTSSWKITEQVEKNKFVTNRGLWDYGDLLPKGFTESLKSLRSDQHWIDLGAGKANAQVEYLKSFSDVSKAAQTTAVAYKIDRWFAPPKFKGKLQVQEGVFEALDINSWKKADLITDVFGVLSYTHDMQTSLQKVFELLKVGGEFYLFVLPESATFYSGSRYLQMIDFLGKIKGLRVEGFFGRIKVTKEQEDIQVPFIGLQGIKDGSPPERHFYFELTD